MSTPVRSRSTVIVLLLVATLAMTATLAYEAQQAARSHRATAENVLRDYSRFAAWELTRLGRGALLDGVHAGLARVQAAMKGGDIGAALGAAGACPSNCAGGYTVLTTFSTSLPGMQFAFTGAPVGEEVRAALEKATAAGLRKPDDFTCPALAIVTVNGAPAVLVWRPSHDRSNAVTGVYGFVADLPFVTGVFDTLLRRTPLLPPTLVPAGTDPNAALAVRVSSLEGRQIFASAAGLSAYEATEQLSRDLGSLQLAVALRSDAAEGLVIGGLPRERLPLVVGLLALTVGLVGVALVQLRRETELSRMRADFVSGVSHELRTPLAQIRMFSETLLLGRVRSATEGRRSLEIIARETQRLIQLVENVLVFSRGERRQPAIRRERALLAPIAADVIEGFTPLAAARGTRLASRLDETLAASVDAGAIRQILLNLLDNAVKYGPEGQTITVTLRREGETARLSVDDEGPGIAGDDAERVWHPFTRLARPDTATGGAGIGLAIVRQLTDLHGGRAWVEPRAAGACFIVELPGASSDATAVTAVA